MGRFLEVLLDWVDESRQFFHRCQSYQKTLSEIVEPFLTPIYPRDSLLAAVKGEDQRPHFEDPFAFDLSILPAGTRVVFSFSRQLTAYAETFLLADRTPDYAYWNFSSNTAIRLPRIYKASSRIAPKKQRGSISHLIHVVKDSTHNFLVLVKGGGIWTLEPQYWDKEKAFFHIPPQNPFHDVSWLGPSYVPGHFYVIREGCIEELVWGEWRISPVRLSVGLPDCSEEFSAYFALSDHNILFQLEDMSLCFKRPEGTVEKCFFTSEKGPVTPAQLMWLPVGSVIFTDVERRELYYGDLSGTYSGINSRSIFGPVDHPSLSFCVDAKGILYVAENDTKRLHVLLPANHWNCPVCGSHGASCRENRRCVVCDAALPEPISGPYYKWFDIDLGSLGAKIGPLAVDSELNLYIVTDEQNVVALPLEKKDFWGKEV